MLAKTLSRRALLRATGMTAAGAALAACQPQVVEKVVKETVEVEKVVKETVVVEVEKEKEVTKIVEVAKLAERTPAEVVLVMYGRNEIGDEHPASVADAGRGRVDLWPV